jgi:two-component system phosphate regulon sensor histidine kinase PhoR
MKGQDHVIRLIGLIVFVTIGMQVYWNYVQFTNNTAQVANDIQEALEASIRTYTDIQTSQNSTYALGEEMAADGAQLDTVQAIVVRVLKELGADPSLNIGESDDGEISYTIMNSSMDLAVLDSIFQMELARKNYAIHYNLSILENGREINATGYDVRADNTLHANAPIFLPGSDTRAELYYVNPFWPSLLKGLAGIILSFILSSAVIFALYYLHQIIKKQKQLTEIKNDFISNVTHEFKTPIATVSGALEGIKHFNNEELSEKTMRYLAISEEQLKKLNLLVEKVMETSLLEVGQIKLDKVPTDIVKILRECVERLGLHTSKVIEFNSSTKDFELDADPFHFDNVISNLLDNAIKYGGDIIRVSAKEIADGIEIKVTDNGQGISKESAPYIFDKFFREQHKTEVAPKGFGIGLYYAKRIIENHGGTIGLEGTSTFKIRLWKK